MAIWFSSDYHFNHRKQFLYEPRGFNNVDDMNNFIIEQHNKLIAPEDEVYLLGDIVMGSADEGFNLVRQLNGKIHIIKGNHDGTTKCAMYSRCPNIVEIADATRLKYKKFNFYLSHYPTITSNFDEPLYKCEINLHGHLHSEEALNFPELLCYDVEFDAHGAPIEINDIIQNLKEIKEQEKWYME